VESAESTICARSCSVVLGRRRSLDARERVVASRNEGWRPLWLVADYDVAHRHSLNAVLRCGLRRVRLDEPFLFVRTNRNDDFVRRKRRKSVANGETDIRLPGHRIDRLARQLLGRAFGDPPRMSERFLVVGEPVERALPYNRHHDLDGFGVPNTPAQNVVGMFDGADDEDVPAHDGNVPQRTSQDDANRLATYPVVGGP
jgi:hypothetical protein